MLRPAAAGLCMTSFSIIQSWPRDPVFVLQKGCFAGVYPEVCEGLCMTEEKGFLAYARNDREGKDVSLTLAPMSAEGLDMTEDALHDKKSMVNYMPWKKNLSLRR